MDLEDTPEQAAFRAECRAFLDAHAPQALRPKLEASTFGRTAFEPKEYLREAKAWQRKKAEHGWACLQWPKEYGGRGATPIQRVIWDQEEGIFARLSQVFIIGHGMCGPTLLAYGTEEQKRAHLPPMASGDQIWCQLFSEPVAGSDLAGIRTRAELRGDEWVINGQKVWTSGAQYSDYGILVCRSDSSVPKHKGMTFFFVDMKSPGIEVRPIQQAAGESGFNEVFFTNVRVPDAHRLGGAGDGWSVSITTLMNERLAIGGSMPTGFDDLFSYLMRLETEGDGVLEDSSVRDKLADWYVRTAGLRYTTYRTLTALAKGQMPGPESSIGKVVAGNTMQEIASFALELQEQAGVLADEQDPDALRAKFPRMLMRSLGTRIEGGTDEILKNIIAERVLQLPGDVRVDRDVAFSDVPGGR
jgi:alkylation response protein AidB-like acyl-CoA dehydrogenase